MKLLADKVFLGFLLSLNVFSVQSVLASEPGCIKAAESWILELNDEKNTELFRRYTQDNCEFSGKWVKKAVDLSSASRRERMCQDLVLIWSHKDCNYFRDFINPDAYEPCRAWSREMHQHCMDNDVDWF